MSRPGAGYPTSVWDGASLDRTNDRTVDASPSYEDWDRLVDELIATQTELDRYKDEQEKEAVNANAGTVAPGAPVYLKSDGTFDKARANSATTTHSIGLLTASTLTTATGVIKINGLVTLTTGQWDSITGGTGGLTVGAPYYVSAATAGLLTTTAPSTSTQFVAMIGVALSATVMLLQKSRAIVVP